MKAFVRAAGPGDEGVLASLNGFVHEAHVAALPGCFKPTRLAELTAWYAAKLDDAAWHSWIAEVDGLAVGYVLAVVQERPDSEFRFGRRYMEIDQLAVDPRHRKQGIARALVRAVAGAALLRGIHEIELSAWSFNEEAQAAFRKLGFAPRTVRFAMDL